jgi:hypothetical protein
MSSSLSARGRPEEPVRHPLAELAAPAGPLVRKLGRVQVPLSIGNRPWATAYRLPSGRTVWCLRLWLVDRPVRAVVSTATLRHYATVSGFPELRESIDRIVAPEAT